jgi:hypothetical protein
MSELKIYEVEQDYVWVCAKTPERAIEIYAEEQDIQEADLKRMIEQEEIIPPDELEPMTETELRRSKLRLYDEPNSETISFYDRLQEFGKEGMFAFSE